MAVKNMKHVTEEDVPDTLLVKLPNRQKVSRLEKNALAKVGEAREIEVTDVPSYKLAAEFAKTCKEFEDSIHLLYDEHVANAHKTHKSLTDARAKLIKPFVEARQIVEREMSVYDLEQRRLANDAAEREAEKKRQLEIKRAKKAGDLELAQELQEEPLEVADVGKVAPMIAGVISKPVVKFEVVNAEKVPRKFLVVDEKAIKAYIKLHGVEAVIEGVRVFEEVQTQIRS